MPPPRPEQRHGVEGDDDVDRVVVARGEDEERLVRVRVRLGSGLVERVVVARGEDMRSACAAHNSIQRARRALVARVEVRKIGWPYLSKASNIVY